MKRISTLAVLALLTVAGAALAQVTLDRKFTPGTYKEETTEGFVQTLKIAGMAGTPALERKKEKAAEAAPVSN